jgi:ABC-type multidrug transport system ATPase subunit
VVVLDELTTGLDPQARRDTWALIEGVRDRGTTIVLVTHFMEEAERLCDRIAVIDSGRIVALDGDARVSGMQGDLVGEGEERRLEGQLPPVRVLPETAAPGPGRTRSPRPGRARARQSSRWGTVRCRRCGHRGGAC